MDVQKRYWQEFVDLKRNALYIGYYHLKTDIIDRFLSGFSAVTASAAVAGWVLWRQTVVILGEQIDFRFVWSALIMLSQILNAVKDQLPYKRRMNALAGFSNDLNMLVLTMENDWFRVERGALTDLEVHDLQMAAKRKIQDSRMKNFAGMTMPEEPRLLRRADRDVRSYFRSYFGEGLSHGG